MQRVYLCFSPRSHSDNQTCMVTVIYRHSHQGFYDTVSLTLAYLSLPMCPLQSQWVEL